MLVVVARRVARELGYGAEQEEVILFGLRVLANQAAALVAVAALGWLAGALGPTLLAVGAAGSVKVFAGGAHAGRSRTCVLLGAACFVPAGWAAARLGPALAAAPAAALGAATSLGALAAVWAWAPQESPGKPLASPEHRRAMRRASFAALTLWLAALAILAVRGWGPAAADPGPWRALTLGGLAGLAWQALSLSPAGHRLAGLADRILGSGKGGWGRDVEEEDRRRCRLRGGDGRGAQRQHHLRLDAVSAAAARGAAAEEGVRPRGGLDRPARRCPGEPG